MNYLAHLYFSDPRPQAWAGSLMGDFFKGSDFSALPADLARHLRLHRRIDSFTCDSLPFQRSRKRLDPRFRFARSILVDVFYDHYLACHWDDYSSQPLAQFSRTVYAGLQDCQPLLSPGLQRQLPHMIAHDWLSSYRQPRVVKRVLQSLEERLGHKFPLSSSYQQWESLRGEMATDFHFFMDEARRFVSDWKRRN
jgi:acyl carrier protein phosphodiesterase